MLSDHLGLYLIGVDIKMLCQMNTKTQAIEEGARTQHAIMPRAGAGDIGEWIGGIGDNQYDCARGRAHDVRNNFAIDFCVLIQEPQSALRIVAVRGAPGLFVDTGGNHHQRSIREIIVISVDNSRLGTKRRSVTEISRHRLRAFTRSVHEDDHPGASAYDCGESTSTANLPCTNDSNL